MLCAPDAMLDIRGVSCYACYDKHKPAQTLHEGKGEMDMHGMIITAYQDYESLKRVIGALSARALCFVHVDAKCGITDAMTAELDAMENVRAIRKYRVNWGSVYHLHALLDLCRMALEDDRVTHLHLISAQDFPTMSADAFEQFFEGDDRIHMQSLTTKDYPELAHRYEHFHFMHLLNYRDMSERAQNWVGRVDRWQDMLHIRRRVNVPHKGLVWASLPRAAAEHAVFAPQNRALLKKLKYTYIPEEFYLQNAFAGTAFEARITGSELRFSIWDEPSRGTPALLDENDIGRIDASGCVFCRKVQTESGLYQALEDRWLGR